MSRLSDLRGCARRLRGRVGLWQVVWDRCRRLSEGRAAGRPKRGAHDWTFIMFGRVARRPNDSMPRCACVALLLACCAPHTAAEGEAAPVQPKNIDISLSARWPASPAAVEAAEFVAEEDNSLFWRFAEGLAKEDAATAKVRRGEGTDREQFDHVIDVASGLLSPLGLRMLKAFFAAHVLSPRAEMWRQVAEDEAQQFEVPAGTTAWLRSCGRALPVDAQPAAAIASLIEAVTG